MKRKVDHGVRAAEIRAIRIEIIIGEISDLDSINDAPIPIRILDIQQRQVIAVTERRQEQAAYVAAGARHDYFFRWHGSSPFAVSE